MRIFIALDIPEDVRGAVRELVAKLKPTCPAARWARVEGMHVTLKFIGETPPQEVDEVRSVLRGIRSAAPVEMQFRGVGFFPDARRPRVFWGGIEASPNLAELAAEVEQRLETLGIPREQRAFRPHLTLARFPSQEGVPALRRALEAVAAFEFGSARANEFHLYESRLKPGGAEYVRLQTFVFVGDA